MTAHDCRVYLGTPYADRGRSRSVGPGSTGVDCWGLVVAFYAREFGIELPSYAEEYASAEEKAEVARLLEEKTSAWRRLPVPPPGTPGRFDALEVGDVLRLSVLDPAVPIHVGIYVGDGEMLHVRRGIPRRGQRAGTSTPAVVESVRTGLWAPRVVDGWRHEARVPTWRLHALPVPWHTRADDLEIPIGTSIAEALARAGFAPGEGGVRVLLEGELVPEREEWNGRAVDLFRAVRPHAGQLVVARAIPGTGIEIAALLAGIGSALGTIGAGLAAIVPGGAAIAGAAGVAAGAAFGTTFVGASLIIGATTFVVGAGIAAGVTYAATKLAGLAGGSEPGGFGSIGPGNSPAANGVGNDVRPWDVIASGLGRFRTFPALGAPPFTEIVEDARSWRLLLVVGKGRFRMRDPETGRPRIFVADVPIDELKGVVYEIHHGEVLGVPDDPVPFQDAYSARVLDPGPNGTNPAHYWRLGDAPASIAAADTVGALPLAVAGAGSVTFGVPALVTLETDTAASFDGAVRLERTDAFWPTGGATVHMFLECAPGAGKRAICSAGRVPVAGSDPLAHGWALYHDGRDLILEASARRRRSSFTGSTTTLYTAQEVYRNRLPESGPVHVAVRVNTSAVSGTPFASASLSVAVNGTLLTTLGLSSTVRVTDPRTRVVTTTTNRHRPALEGFTIGAAVDTAGAPVAGFAGEIDEVAFVPKVVPDEDLVAFYRLGSGATAEAAETRGQIPRYRIFSDSVIELQVNAALPPAPHTEPLGTTSDVVARQLRGRMTELSVVCDVPTLFRVNEEGKDRPTGFGLVIEYRAGDDPDGWQNAVDAADFRAIGRFAPVTVETLPDGSRGVRINADEKERFLLTLRWSADVVDPVFRAFRVETEGPGNRGGSDTASASSTFTILAFRAAQQGEPPLRVEGLTTIELELPFDVTGGTVGRVSVVAERMLRIYEPSDPEANAAGWTPYRVTRNAADAALAVLTDRDLHPDPYLDDEVDREAFRALRARAANFDLEVDFASNEGDLPDLILQGSRASLDDAGDGTITVVEDRPGLLPTGWISPATARGFRGVKRFAELPHARRVVFFDEENNWREDQLLVYDDGFSERGEVPGTVAASRFEVLQERGQTNRAALFEFHRIGMAALRLRSEEWTCEVWLDHIAYKRGSVIPFTHPTALVGDKWGRVVEVETNGDGDVVAIWLDQEWSYAAGVDYAARLHIIDDGTATAVLVDAPIVHPGPDPARRLVFVDPVAPPLPQRQDHVAVGPVGSVTFDGMIREIRPRDDGAADVVVIPYAPAIFDAGDGPVPFDPQVTTPPAPQDRAGPARPRIARIESDARWLLRTPRGIVTRARVEVAPQSSNQAHPASFRARARPVDPPGAWKDGAWTAATAPLFVEGLTDGRRYEFEVQGQAVAGLTSPWSLPLQHDVVGQLGPPPAVTSFWRDGDVLRWLYPFDEVVDFAGFEIRYRYSSGFLNRGRARHAGNTWQGGIRAHNGLIASTELPLSVLPTGASLTVFLVPRDLLGIYGEPAVLLLDQGFAAGNVVRTISEGGDGWPGTIAGGSVVGDVLEADLVGLDQAGTAVLAGDRRSATVSGFAVSAVRRRDFFSFDADGPEFRLEVLELDTDGNRLVFEEPLPGTETTGACTVAARMSGATHEPMSGPADAPMSGTRSAELLYTARTFRPEIATDVGQTLRLETDHAPDQAEIRPEFRELGTGQMGGPADEPMAADLAAPMGGAGAAWSPWRPFPGELDLLRKPYEVRARILEDARAATELRAFDLVVDVEDVVIRLADLVVGPLPRRLPLGVALREIQGLRGTLQAFPGDDATGFRVVDYQPNGPLIEPIPPGSRGTFDFTVEGY